MRRGHSLDAARQQSGHRASFREFFGEKDTHGKEMTDDVNTSISAVAVLEPTRGDVPRLVIYRTLYAAIPIEPVVITRLRAVQRDIDLERMEWITVESGRREH